MFACIIVLCRPDSISPNRCLDPGDAKVAMNKNFVSKRALLASRRLPQTPRAHRMESNPELTFHVQSSVELREARKIVTHESLTVHQSLADGMQEDAVSG